MFAGHTRLFRTYETDRSGSHLSWPFYLYLTTLTRTIKKHTARFKYLRITNIHTEYDLKSLSTRCTIVAKIGETKMSIGNNGLG